MTDLEDHAFIKLRSGLSIRAPQMAAIEKELASLLEAVPAKMILLVDTSGQLVCSAGDVRDIDTTGLGSLIAGDLAASQMIARMTGEFQEFQMILREGERSHMIISEAGHHLTFLVQFSKDVPLGWARKLIQRQATILKGLADQSGQETDESTNESTVEFMSGGDLPDMFSGALDDIWKG